MFLRHISIKLFAGRLSFVLRERKISNCKGPTFTLEMKFRGKQFCPVALPAFTQGFLPPAQSATRLRTQASSPSIWQVEEEGDGLTFEDKYRKLLISGYKNLVTNLVVNFVISVLDLGVQRKQERQYVLVSRLVVRIK